jgi:uncharacterized protein
MESDMTVVLAFLLMLLIVGGMALGVMAGRKPISGSCGGIARLGMDTGCEICGGNPVRCREEKGAIGRDEGLAYDATQERPK